MIIDKVFEVVSALVEGELFEDHSGEMVPVSVYKDFIPSSETVPDLLAKTPFILLSESGIDDGGKLETVTINGLVQLYTVGDQQQGMAELRRLRGLLKPLSDPKVSAYLAKIKPPISYTIGEQPHPYYQLSFSVTLIGANIT